VNWLNRVLSARNLMLVALAAGAIVMYRASATEANLKANEALLVPVIVLPPVQPVKDQVLLFKATNITEAPVSFRLSLFNEREGLAVKIQDFANVAPGTTVSYTYVPPMTTIDINGTSLEAPEAVRALFEPLPGDTPNAIRRVVASVQLMRFQSPAGPTPVLEAPIPVPLEHCRFEPKNFVPYKGGRWVWNCAPAIHPTMEGMGGQNNRD